jgi:hypothetical protein
MKRPRVSSPFPRRRARPGRRTRILRLFTPALCHLSLAGNEPSCILTRVLPGRCCRDARTRTEDPPLPKRMRSLLRHIPSSPGRRIAAGRAFMHAIHCGVLNNQRPRHAAGAGARAAGVEPTRGGFGDRCSAWLSYTRLCYLLCVQQKTPPDPGLGGRRSRFGYALTFAACPGSAFRWRTRRRVDRRTRRPPRRAACAAAYRTRYATTCRFSWPGG